MDSNVMDGSTLEKEIHALWKRTVPGPVILQARKDLIQRVSTMIKSRYGTQYTVVSFGSTSYGVSSASSDLDLTVVDGDRPDGFSPDVDMERLPPIYNPNNLAKTLANHLMRDVVPIRANVPIVKFTDNVTKLQCDINVNEQFGFRNSRLLRAYLDLTPVGRKLTLVLKTWARQRGLNDPSAANGPTTLSSYSLTLLLLAYLQQIGHLPNLQDPDVLAAASVQPSHLWLRPATGHLRRHKRNKKDKKPPASTGPVTNSNEPDQLLSKPLEETPVNDPGTQIPLNEANSPAPLESTEDPNDKPRASTSNSPRSSCNTTFATHVPDSVNWKQTPVTLVEALTGFFAYFSHTFNYETHVVDIGRGGIALRESPYVEPHPVEKVKKKKRESKRERRKKQKDTTQEDKSEDQNKELSDSSKAAKLDDPVTAAVSSAEDPAEGDSAKVQHGDEAIIDDNAEEPAIEPATLHTDVVDDELAATDDGEPQATTVASGTDVWKGHLLVIQDPFIRTRNTSQNIRALTVRGIIAEFTRASDVLSSGASLDVLCELREGPAVGEDNPRRRQKLRFNPTDPPQKDPPTTSNDRKDSQGKNSELSTVEKTDQRKARKKQGPPPAEVKVNNEQGQSLTALSETNQATVPVIDPIPPTMAPTDVLVSTSPTHHPHEAASTPTPRQLLEALQMGARRRQQTAHQHAPFANSEGPSSSKTANPPIMPSSEASELAVNAIKGVEGSAQQRRSALNISASNFKQSQGPASPHRVVVKGIGRVPPETLKAAIAQRFGPFTHFDLRDRAAFVEFEDAASARNAIAASSPGNRSQGGFWVDIDHETRVQATIKPYFPRTRPHLNT